MLHEIYRLLYPGVTSSLTKYVTVKQWKQLKMLFRECFPRPLSSSVENSPSVDLRASASSYMLLCTYAIHTEAKLAGAETGGGQGEDSRQRALSFRLDENGLKVDCGHGGITVKILNLNRNTGGGVLGVHFIEFIFNLPFLPFLH